MEKKLLEELYELRKKYDIKMGWNDEVIWEMGKWLKWRHEIKNLKIENERLKSVITALKREKVLMQTR
jgi:hypothetical protein